MKRLFKEDMWASFTTINIAIGGGFPAILTFLTWIFTPDTKVELRWCLPIGMLLLILVSCLLNLAYHYHKILLSLEREEAKDRENTYFLTMPEAIYIPKLSNFTGDYSYLDHGHYIVIQNNIAKTQVRLYRKHTGQEYQVTGGFENVLKANPALRNQIGKTLTDEIPIFKQAGRLNVQIFEKGVMIWEGNSGRAWHYPE